MELQHGSRSVLSTHRSDSWSDASLLTHQCRTIAEGAACTCPGPDFVDRIVAASDRSPRVLGSLQSAVRHRPACGTGYVSILPVDQGIEHSAGASFAPNPAYFDPENIVKLGDRRRLQRRGVDARRARARSRASYAHKIPFILKFNHNEFISYPNTYDQIRFASVKQAFDMGAPASARRSISGRRNRSGRFRKSREMFQQAHELGMFTVLWCYLRNAAFKTKEADYHLAADLTGQANHLGVTIEADIIKQKLPETNGGYTALNFGKTHKEVYSQLTTDNPIDLTRYQLANCYMGRAPLINSGGASPAKAI